MTITITAYGTAMPRISILLSLVIACSSPPDKAHRVGGQVHGLWDGADGVVLRLQADGVDTVLTVSANTAFRFAAPLAQGASYTVTVAANPARHTCAVDAGASGTIANADVVDVSIACTGPATAIELSGPWGWTFDPTREVQTFEGSIVAQDVALTITGDSLDGAHVRGAAVALGEETPPIALPLGPTIIPVGVTATGGLSKTYQLVFDRGGSVLDQLVYGKASNAASRASFGVAVALSGDTLAIGAVGEASGATGVDGDQADTSAESSGAVYVFVRTGTTWIQQAYLKASNTEKDDLFGSSVAVFGDTLAVGAVGEDSGAAGVNPIDGQADNGMTCAGAVYVFARAGTAWTQQAYLKASNPGAFDQFGYSVALSSDTLAVGAFGEASQATGVDGDQTDDRAVNAGAVYLFVRDGASWTQQAYLKASNTGAFDEFGNSVALSGDTLAVGAPGEASQATGVDGDQADDGAIGAGATYVFVRTGTSWTQQAYLKASNTGATDVFGYSVALSGDTLAVGARGESSNATGVDPAGGGADDSATNAGAAYVFVRRGAIWAQQAYVKASNPGPVDYFGASVALSDDTLAVAAPGEASDAAGVNGDQTDNTASSAGAVYLFARGGTTWTQQAYVKASNTEAFDGFGTSVALSRNTLAIGTPGEAGGAKGINPSNGQTDNSASHAGAVYFFR